MPSSAWCSSRGPGRGDEGAVLVDTLSDQLSLEPLYELFRNRNVVKVFHAARQDLEIFQTEAGVLPGPFFDTQVAAMVCGYGDQVGYETLVRQIARATIDKSSRFTDWSRRPLSAAQMTYALADVTHLRQIYEVLARRLEETGRGGLGRGGAGGPDRPRHLPQRARGGLDPDQDPLDRAALPRGAARARPAARDAGADAATCRARASSRTTRCSSWRRTARRRREELAKSRLLLREGRRGEVADGILAAIAAAETIPAADVPQAPEQPSRKPGAEALADLLRVLLKARAEAEGVAQRLIASSADLDAHRGRRGRRRAGAARLAARGLRQATRCG